ncbi:MAG TPA: hypothetical protein VKQ08_10495 [Cyclobacteriaceae bacterium]|nr:hypothetical protein [Cyclobacteriaceae bacterium]
MKKIYLSLPLIIGMTIAAQSQNIPKAIQDSACKYYILVNQMASGKNEYYPTAFNTLIDMHKKYRTECLKYCKTPKDSARFFDIEIKAYKKSS